MYSESARDGGLLSAGAGCTGRPSTTVNNNSSFSPGENTKRTTQNSGLLPLTVKQLSSASQRPSDENLYVDGQEVMSITLVGMVSCKEEKATDVSFVLDDYTGKIGIKRWSDGHDAGEFWDIRAIRNGTYVRVHGQLRSFQGKVNLVAFTVRDIEDFNEVTFHFLECIYVHLTNTANAEVPGIAALGAPADAGLYSAPTGAHDRGGDDSTNPHSQSTASPVASTVSNSATECQRRVQAIFDDPASTTLEVGLHKDDVVQRMVGYNQQQVLAAISFLAQEGSIYSSIDENHYRSANF